MSSSGNPSKMPGIWLWVTLITNGSRCSHSCSSPNPVARLRNEGADNCKKHLSCTWSIDSILADTVSWRRNTSFCFKTRRNNSQSSTELLSIIGTVFGGMGARGKERFGANIIGEWFGANRQIPFLKITSDDIVYLDLDLFGCQMVPKGVSIYHPLRALVGSRLEGAGLFVCMLSLAIYNSNQNGCFQK